MGFWEEDHRGKMLLSSHHIEGTRSLYFLAHPDSPGQSEKPRLPNLGSDLKGRKRQSQELNPNSVSLTLEPVPLTTLPC